MTVWTDLQGVEYEVLYVDAGGTRTRSLQSGHGDAVVFLHGTSGHLEAFSRNIAAHAAAGYRCHAIDMLGHGYTDPADTAYTIPRYAEHLVAYLDAVGIDRAHLVGESLGGWVSAWLAAERPDRVGRLSLVAAGGTVANPVVMERLKSSTTEAVMGDDIALTRKRLELLMHDPANVTDELVQVRYDIYHQKSFQAHLSNLLSLQEMEIRQQYLLTAERLNRIDAPTLIVWSRQNPFGALPEAEFMRDNISGSTLVVFEDCGHWPQYEHADQFNELQLAFLAGQ